jgi:hypothetical protein
MIPAHWLLAESSLRLREDGTNVETESAPDNGGTRRDSIQRHAVLAEVERLVVALSTPERTIRTTEHLRGAGEHL